jgi:hypothetical protein
LYDDCGAIPVAGVGDLTAKEIAHIGFKCLAVTALVKMAKYFNCNTECPLLVMGLFLDPRAKNRIWASWGQPLIRRIEETISKVFGEMETEILEEQRQGSTHAPDSQIQDNDDEPFWAQIVTPSIHDMRGSFVSELEEYRMETISLTIDLDVLEYWKSRSRRWKVLPRLAQKYFGIPCSSVPSEEIFSAGRRVLTDYRKSMTAETFEAVMESKAVLDTDRLVNSAKDSDYMVEGGNNPVPIADPDGDYFI